MRGEAGKSHLSGGRAEPYTSKLGLEESAVVSALLSRSRQYSHNGTEQLRSPPHV